MCFIIHSPFQLLMLHKYIYDIQVSSGRPSGAEIFDKHDPIREALTFIGNLWGEAFLPLPVSLDKSNFKKRSAFVPTSLSHYKKEAGNFGNSEDIKREFAAKWGVDYKTNRLIPPALV